MRSRNEQIIEQRNNAWASRSLGRVLRAFCCECMGGQRSQIEGCTALDCALYPFRNGGSTRAAFDDALIIEDDYIIKVLKETVGDSVVIGDSIEFDPYPLFLTDQVVPEDEAQLVLLISGGPTCRVIWMGSPLPSRVRDTIEVTDEGTVTRLIAGGPGTEVVTF